MNIVNVMIYVHPSSLIVHPFLRCNTILRFIEKQQRTGPHTSNDGSGGFVPSPVRLDNMVYHRTITVCGAYVLAVA